MMLMLDDLSRTVSHKGLEANVETLGKGIP